LVPQFHTDNQWDYASEDKSVSAEFFISTLAVHLSKYSPPLPEANMVVAE